MKPIDTVAVMEWAMPASDAGWVWAVRVSCDRAEKDSIVSRPAKNIFIILLAVNM